MATVFSLKNDSSTAAMYDLESGKKMPEVVVVDADTDRPILGRRKTSGSLQKQTVAAPASPFSFETAEDSLTKIGNLLYKIHSASIITRYALYILPVAAILAIPLIITATIHPGAHAGNVRLVGLFTWIEVIWVALWLCKLIASTLPVIFQAACGLISTGIRKYSLVLMALEIPVSLLLWSVASFGAINIMFRFQHVPGWHDSKDPTIDNLEWVRTLSTVFKAGIIVAAVFLGEKTFIQLISINYHRKQYDSKIKENKQLIGLLDLLYDASRTLFPDGCKEFQDEDEEIKGNTLTSVRNGLAKVGVKTRVFSKAGLVRDKLAAAFGAMASDISGKKVFNTTSAHSIVIEALETERSATALARRLWLSFVAEGKDALYKQDLIEVLGISRIEEAEDIFHLLDRDGNGDVSLEEMTLLVVGVGQERKNVAASMHDIGEAIAVLDRLLSLVVVVAIAFIYATFFSATFAAKTTQLWTTFTGLSFAIGGTLTEFLNCCFFIFVKHPYDVGDRVNISNVELVVEHISLMYSVFRRVDSDAKVHIPHGAASSLWIENVSRSKQMKERLDLHVAATTSTEDILALRSELEKFVNHPDNKRDFQPDFDIELRSVGDLKQLELRVEMRHKSNFANEPLRNARRNKFMVELLAAARRIPLEPPGGAGAGLGTPNNPAYSVTISDSEAAAVRDAHAQEVAAKRLFPPGQFLAEQQEQQQAAGITTAFDPVGSMVNTLIGRRNNSIAISLNDEKTGIRRS